jgi:hypothetical protein
MKITAMKMPILSEMPIFQQGQIRIYGACIGAEPMK